MRRLCLHIRTAPCLSRHPSSKLRQLLWKSPSRVLWLLRTTTSVLKLKGWLRKVSRSSPPGTRNSGHMACSEEFGPVRLFKSLNFSGSCQGTIQTGMLIKAPLALSATVLWASGATCSKRFRAEAGFAKAGNAEFSLGRNPLAKHEIPGHMTCHEEFGPV